ncbi:unnamed protein product [Trichobilharzia szidati]|nr:unnamed protein product [Trichobilharzia szidati]
MLQMSDLLTHHTASDSDDIGDEVIRTMFMVANKLEESMRLAYNSCEYTPYDSPAEHSSLNGEAFYPESGELPESKYEHNEYIHPHIQYEDEFDLDSRTSYMDMKTTPCSQTTENNGSPGSRNSLFECCECDRRFKSKSVLRRHVRVVHEGVTYPCEQCGKSFSRKWNLKQHINSVHERQIFQCDNCEKSFSSKNILLRHVRSSHEGVCYKCDQCDKSFSRKYDLNQHVVYWHYESYLKSKNLNGISLKEDTLQEPVEIPQQSALFKCEQCDEIFSSMSRLREHRISHEYSQLTQIPYESLFPQKYDMNKDKLFQHEGKPFICQQCGRGCSSKGILRRHIRITHEGRNFPCDQCGKTFTRECNLKEHRLAFHEGKFFKCDECDGSYSSRSILLRHVKYVHRGIHFRCDLCDKIFSRTYHLRIHQMSVHERVRFSCDQCDKTFSHKFDLKMHKSTFHEGLYYHCNLCDRKFSRMSHLRTHQFSVHEVSTYSSRIRLLPQSDKVSLSKEEENSMEYIYRKKFRCNQCQMCFKRNYQLKLHSKLFHGKRYRCHKCGRMYEFYGYLKKHLLFSHKNLCSLQLS